MMLLYRLPDYRLFVPADYSPAPNSTASKHRINLDDAVRGEKLLNPGRWYLFHPLVA